MTSRFFLACGLGFMILAVMLGAFGAHAIKGLISAQQMATWQTASEYHFFHALGLITLGIWLDRRTIDKLLIAAGWMLSIGILLFSGSLYLLVVSGNLALGMVTPIGGIFLILGWACWCYSVIKNSAGSNQF